jgi:hypothetical protein
MGRGSEAVGGIRAGWLGIQNKTKAGKNFSGSMDGCDWAWIELCSATNATDCGNWETKMIYYGSDC